MDSRIGLDYIVENREYVSKLGAALDTSNVVVKKQVFELLSALCAYNADGYARALETLEYYKNLKNERYRFKIVINELEKATNVEYEVALLAFINCVIISATSVENRIRIRNEFIGLKVLPLLNNLRKVAESVGDIIVQLDVFDEQRECDEVQSLQGPNGINLNSHLDIFYAILRQVADTPQEVPFLSILQHLLRIDPKEPVSDIIWDTTEKLVHRATLLENDDDSVRLLRTSGAQKFTCPHCRSDSASPSRKPSGVPASPNSNTNAVPPPPLPAKATTTATSAPPAPPAPLGPGFGGAPPPPPPPPLMGPHSQPPAPPPPPIPGAPPPAPPPPVSNKLHPSHAHPTRPITPEPGCNEHAAVLLPQQETPAPKAKMKTINWNKIPHNRVIGGQNIWTIVANNHQHGPTTDIDFNEMEGLFCLQSTSTQGSPKLGRDGSNSSGYDTLDRKSKKENTEITLLDGKRSLNVNIFLKQFRTTNNDIIVLIRRGKHNEIGAEKLRGLLKILPEVDELDMLKTFNGDQNRLGNAEKFLLQLMEVPNYKLRIESMLLKEEFAANISYLEPCISAMLYAGDDLMTNKMLQEVLYMVVVAGNFLNSGGYAGNAAGVKLSSLQKLTDIRANKPGMNLIHFVAIQAEKRNPELLKFPAQLGAIENASKTTSEQISNEIHALDARIRKIKRQIQQPATDDDIKEQMHEFLLTAEREVAVLQAGMKEVEAMRHKLSDFFCEDPTTFRLEECFKVFHSFCEKFKQAVKENERRQQLEEQANLRRKQREEQLMRRAKQANQCSTPVSDSENQFLLDPSFDPRASPALSRRRMGSFNSGVDVNGFMRLESNDGMSPDITPNGSLRRRRSRVLAEEDDLMEFLRTSSGHEHISRERKAYGSLDRSWARRARSGSASRKRPDLLNIDFGVDRERPSSPAPAFQQQPNKQSPQTPNASEANSLPITAQQQQQPQEDAKPRISREWRQKIENWLQLNENDEKQNEEYKRKRRLINNSRRSLENDIESERKLDTLPEEKIVPTTPGGAATTSDTNNNTNLTNNVNHYKRVYPDWRPSNTLEHTDVVGTMQAIADANSARDQQQRNQQNFTFTQVTNANDKSASNSNCLTTAEELREYRRQRSLEHSEKHTNAQLHSIAEEDRRKSYIKQVGERNDGDRLQIYIRRPLNRDGQSPDGKLQSPKTPTIQVVKSPTATVTTAASSLTKTASNTKVNTPNSPNVPHRKTYGTAFKYDNDDNIPKKDDTFSSLLNHHHSQNENYSRKEIDADNIETPPVTRRSIASPSASERKEKGVSSDFEPRNETTNRTSTVDQDSPGHFDRYSLTRRTRRYKRPTDYSSGNEELTLSKETTETNNLRNTKVKGDAATTTTNARRHPASEEITVTQRPIPEKTITKLEKVGRHISSINQEDVREAIRNLKSPTGTPERIWSPPRDILSHQNAPMLANANANSGTSAAHGGTTIIKVSNHELNDEGFEETQSLVSDTPSHGKESTNSSCNEVIEPPRQTRSPNTQKSAKAKPGSSTRLADRLQISKLRATLPDKSSVGPSKSSTAIRPAEGERSRSLRLHQNSTQAANYPAAVHLNNYTNNAIRRTNALRKTIGGTPSPSQSAHGSPSHGVAGRRDVERSSSRNSLRSSRSSINSAASTNTVRRMPALVVAKTAPLQTVSVDSSPSKRPLTAQNTPYLRTGNAPYRSSANSGVPASRSSSSGSSVGPNVIVVRKAAASGNNRSVGGSNLGSTSFKENQTQHASPSRTNAARTAVLVKAAISHAGNSPTHTGGHHTGQPRSGSRSTTNAKVISGFMRPTASSATKRNK